MTGDARVDRLLGDARYAPAGERYAPPCAGPRPVGLGPERPPGPMLVYGDVRLMRQCSRSCSVFGQRPFFGQRGSS